MDADDFQFLLAAQLVEEEEMDSLYGDNEVDTVPKNG
jgi:hypothetical protein